MNKERLALALGILSRRLKFKDMSNDEMVLLGFEREVDDSGHDYTASYIRYIYLKRQAIEMAERIILEALTSKPEKDNECPT